LADEEVCRISAKGLAGRKLMPVYTVHQPPLRRRESESDPARVAFVRDGFSFWAFLLGPLWMLWHRLWLVLIGYLVVVTALQVALAKIGAPGSAKVAVGLLVAILVGLEASSLRRWTLRRRGWTDLGVVVADDLSLAERRFYDSWVAGTASISALPIAAAPPRMASAAPGDVIGLFPRPGGRP
jgi:hypothetical protein